MSETTTEREMRERESELAEVQRIAKVGGVVVDLRDGFRNYRSPEYLALHGLPPQAAKESHSDWVQRIHPDDRDRTERHFLDVLQGSSDRYAAEYRIVRPSDGEIRWIAVEARIERGADGRAIKLVGAHMDITERSLAREMLRESEERFRLIADSAPVPIWVTQLDRTRSFANRAYTEFVGLPYKEALAFDWRTILHPDDADRVKRESVAGEASLAHFTLEARFRDAAGEYRWIRSESQPRWDPAGRHIGFIGVAHDITDAKRAEINLRSVNERLEGLVGERTNELRSRESQLLAILETTNQYQGLLDLHGRLLYANATSLAAAEVNLEDVVGRPFAESVWFVGTDGAMEAIERGVRDAVGGSAFRKELELNLPGGRRHLDVALRPVTDQSGRVTAILAEAVDTTDHRTAEEALRQAQKMEAVGQLTGGVAHDFNNLLTIIRSATDFLRRRDLSEDRRRRYVDAISDTTDRASRLTSQLLAFARRQPLAPVIFDVAAQVRNVASLVQPLVGARIAIEVKETPSKLFALADIGQFETALVNLAVNARDAMNGEGQITISCREADGIPPVRSHGARQGEFVAITIADGGAGIPAEHLQAIFEPFFSTKQVGQGTGLGLSQVFGFAKQSGGDVLVSSLIGAGSVFTIYLPRALEPATAGAVALPSVDSAGGFGNCILVVEDNAEVGRFSTELLEDLGYATDWATSADQALAMLAEKASSYDLVFSDVIMPGMNGVELATIIRDRYPGLPVVLTSGYSSVLADHAHQGFELVQKPYSVEVLSHVLRKSIGNRNPISEKGAP